MFRKFLVLTLIGLFFSFSIVRADGMVMSRENYYLNEADQKVALFFKDGKEEMYLLVGTEGSAKDFAWIVPTPLKPEVNEAPPALFNDLDQKTQKKDKLYEKILDWLGMGSNSQGYKDVGMTQTMGIDAPGSSKSTVQVVEQKYNMGIYDTATLKSKNAEDLYEWLKENNYNVPSNGKSILEEYISKDWYFVAMKISDDYKTDKTSADLKSKNIRPIKLNFSADRITFPLKISSIDVNEANNLTEIESALFNVMPDQPTKILPSDRLVVAGIPEAKILEWEGQYNEYLKTNDSGTFKKSIHDTVSALSRCTRKIKNNLANYE